MVAPIGVIPEGATLPSGERSRGGMYYDCRLQDTNGDCMIYESRPLMCRSFPDRPPCPRLGCTA
jgi:Fe-S-cluster containining protein